MTMIKGKAYVLGDDIDTDQIIPAEHLVYSTSDKEERKNYGRFALSSVPEGEQGLPQGNIPFVQGGKHLSEFSVIIGGKNFGCGSSREHAPLALNIAGVKAVVAESYARIFYRNSVDGAFFIPAETAERLCEKVTTGDELEVDIENQCIRNSTKGETYCLHPLGDVKAIIDAGGLFAYARKNNLI